MVRPEDCSITLLRDLIAQNDGFWGAGQLRRCYVGSTELMPRVHSHKLTFCWILNKRGFLLYLHGDHLFWCIGKNGSIS